MGNGKMVKLSNFGEIENCVASFTAAGFVLPFVLLSESTYFLKYCLVAYLIYKHFFF